MYVIGDVFEIYFFFYIKEFNIYDNIYKSNKNYKIWWKYFDW